GVQKPVSDFVKMELDPKERAGLLTQASFLASRAHATDPSWVYRGKFVRERLLCQTMPPPPPNVKMSVPQDPERTKNPSCKGCHTLMDPIGYGFDAYDAIGRYHAGNARPGDIEDPGGSLDVSGSFDGPVALARELAASRDVSDCMVTQWVRYAVR